MLQGSALTYELWPPVIMEVVTMTGKKIQFKHLRRIHLMENDAQVDQGSYDLTFLSQSLPKLSTPSENDCFKWVEKV